MWGSIEVGCVVEVDDVAIVGEVVFSEVGYSSGRGGELCIPSAINGYPYPGGEEVGQGSAMGNDDRVVGRNLQHTIECPVDAGSPLTTGFRSRSARVMVHSLSISGRCQKDCAPGCSSLSLAVGSFSQILIYGGLDTERPRDRCCGLSGAAKVGRCKMHRGPLGQELHQTLGDSFCISGSLRRE